MCSFNEDRAEKAVYAWRLKAGHLNRGTPGTPCSWDAGPSSHGFPDVFHCFLGVPPCHFWTKPWTAATATSSRSKMLALSVSLFRALAWNKAVSENGGFAFELRSSKVEEWSYSIGFWGYPIFRQTQFSRWHSSRFSRGCWPSQRQLRWTDPWCANSFGCILEPPEALGAGSACGFFVRSVSKLGAGGWGLESSIDLKSWILRRGTKPEQLLNWLVDSHVHLCTRADDGWLKPSASVLSCLYL